MCALGTEHPRELFGVVRLEPLAVYVEWHDRRSRPDRAAVRWDGPAGDLKESLLSPPSKLRFSDARRALGRGITRGDGLRRGLFGYPQVSVLGLVMLVLNPSRFLAARDPVSRRGKLVAHAQPSATPRASVRTYRPSKRCGLLR